ncbi:hypothetical protein KIH77_08710 [Bifidobacterium sp. 82T24]|uniref:hypothetical protein n=1 Tax=Bifidobacterium pluvialisilvae TaxID=2834436 RepID=UPI001C5750FD|nr:hypothetical protein [Bifidobacterium pluvialisilvae]MBW3088803.1 hypothetical protein [Bifidobacterium pluvialisilvae]
MRTFGMILRTVTACGVVALCVILSCIALGTPEGMRVLSSQSMSDSPDGGYFQAVAADGTKYGCFWIRIQGQEQGREADSLALDCDPLGGAL